MNQIKGNSNRKKDIPLFVSTDPNKLKIPELAVTSGEMGDMKGGRIPAVIRVTARKNLIIAAADVGNEGADWGCLGLGIRLSYDDGNTWSDLKKVLSLQAHRAPQLFDDWQSPFVIDPVMVVANDGSIIIILDMFPESKGFAKSSWLDQSGYREISGKKYMMLYDGESKVDDKEGADPGCFYTVREQGWIYDSNGCRTNYYLPQNHSSKHQFSTIGDLYYAVGQPDYLETCPPLIPTIPGENEDIYVGNVYISSGKQPFQSENPVFVQKRQVGPGLPVHSDYSVVETDPAPLTASVYMHLWSIKSRDGEIWEQPVDITSQVRIEEDQVFLGTGPGVGIVLSRQKDSSKNGRIMIPLYNGTGRKECAAAIYSDDNGNSWTRVKGSGFIHNKDEVQIVELFDGTLMSFGRQDEMDGNKVENPWGCRFPDTPVSYSYDGGETWSNRSVTSLPSVMCQKSVIAYPIDDGMEENSPFAYPQGMSKGKQYLICAHSTGVSNYKESARTDGTISLGEVQPDYSVRWIAHKPVKDNTYEGAKEEWLRNFFGYSSLCVLENGNIGLLYEPLPNNYIAFAMCNLEWILSEEEIK